MIRVVLCHPCYGGLVANSVTGAARATRRRDEVTVHLYYPNHALLAKGFNEPIAHALRENYDYFALLHGDIQPSDWWLDDLLMLLQKHQLDAIHAVSPIKDGRGLTSTAIGYNSDVFAPVRRITTTELQELPSTFTIDDIRVRLDAGAERLLPNTGCLLLPATTWLRGFPGFCVLDRIVREGDDWGVDTCPEDWHFGHWCANNGVRIAGTSAVRVRHYGVHEYDSQQKWGWGTDQDFQKAMAQLQGVCDEI